jgi:hypothetical protein
MCGADILYFHILLEKIVMTPGHLNPMELVVVLIYKKTHEARRSREAHLIREHLQMQLIQELPKMDLYLERVIMVNSQEALVLVSSDSLSDLRLLELLLRQFVFDQILQVTQHLLCQDCFHSTL